MTAEDFFSAYLPPPPVPLLEVGCGEGELARSLATRGYDVTAIDPHAPEGEPFVRTTLEDYQGPGDLAAVVASRSLHHVSDLQGGLAKIASLLTPGGRLILNEFAWDRMDEATASWYVGHVEHPGPEHDNLRPPAFPDAWAAEHAGMHDSAAMREALEQRFDVEVFESVPYIAENYLKRPELVAVEARLIAEGRICPLGIHFVGVPRRDV